LSFFERRRLGAAGFLKDADLCFKITCNAYGCLLLGDAFGLNIDQRLPETRPPDGKPNEAGNARRGLQPMHDAASLRAASQHNETNVIASTTPSYFHQLDAIFLEIKPFDLPDIWLNPGVLQRLDGLVYPVIMSTSPYVSELPVIDPTSRWLINHVA
jgi:hypothetical protein